MADDMDMSQNSAQFAMWKLLGETRVVADAVDAKLRPWQAESDAQRKGRVGAGALDLGKVAGGREASAVVAKGKARITAARHGNAFVVTHRRD